MPNNLALITQLIERGIPLVKNGKDLHRVRAQGRGADLWLETHGELQCVALVVSEIDGHTELDALVYQ